jgi:hypothetical protein
MKIIIVLLIGLIGGSAAAYAQNTTVTGNNNKPVIILPENTRYQILTMLQIDLIFVRLDRYTGKTHIYDPGRRRWYPLEVRGGLPAATSNTPKYQIYTEENNNNFLLNGETGQSWIFTVRTWEPVSD